MSEKGDLTSFEVLSPEAQTSSDGSPGQRTSSCDESPGQPTSSCDESPGKPTSSYDESPGQPTSSYDESPGQPTSSCDESPGKPTAGDGVKSEKDRTQIINKLCATCGSDDGRRNPLRVVIIGKHGSGKSSFIDSIAAGLSEDRWSEHAKTGLLKNAGGITVVNRRYEKCCTAGRERYADVLLPTLIDVAGLTENPDDRIEELLTLLFYGHIEEDDSLMRVYTDCKQLSMDAIRQKYRTCYPKMRVDRVIFVAAADKELPVRLMQCVHRVANPEFDRRERREVPLFGVLTHKDNVDLKSPAFLEKKEQFLGELGLIRPRLLICSNYCDKLDPDNQRTERLQPELDVPILNFINEVCDGARVVTGEKQVLPGAEVTDVKEKGRSQRPAFLDDILHNLAVSPHDLAISVLCGFIALLLAVFVIMPGPDASIKEDCILGRISNGAVCSQFSFRSTLTRWMFDLVLTVIVTATVLVVLRARRP